jgi:hypothetical protein
MRGLGNQRARWLSKIERGRKDPDAILFNARVLVVTFPFSFHPIADAAEDAKQHITFLSSALAMQGHSVT